MLEYKGYTGTAEFDDEIGAFQGEVAHLRDVITFEGTSVDELRQAFRDSIDDYLEWCAQRGKEAENQHSLLRKNFIYTFFEVDARYVALAALTELAKIGKLEWSVVQGAMQDFGIKDDKKNPLLV